MLQILMSLQYFNHGRGGEVRLRKNYLASVVSGRVWG